MKTQNPSTTATHSALGANLPVSRNSVRADGSVRTSPYRAVSSGRATLLRSRTLARLALSTLCLLWTAHAQINTGSDGHDGAFNPTNSIVVDMSDHPDGIYQYTSVNIPSGVTVTFTPNANNTPVTWLVQSDCVISGVLILTGQGGAISQGGQGGPGGYMGGNAGTIPSSGQGPGGGISSLGYFGGGASYGDPGGGPSSNLWGRCLAPGPVYGNRYLIPLLGGSGGGGGPENSGGGGGGGGAIAIVAANTITLNGSLRVSGGNSGANENLWVSSQGGGGSGGAARLVASKIAGSGQVAAMGGNAYFGGGGNGRVRFDTYENDFAGSAGGVFTEGSQFIILPSAGQLPQLTITSVGGVPVSSSPTGVLSTPDAVLSAQQNNPIPIVVNCANLPLNTAITVSVKPAVGPPVSAVGQNTTGTLASSTATVSINMPRGGGLIYATAATSN